MGDQSTRVLSVILQGGSQNTDIQTFWLFLKKELTAGKVLFFVLVVACATNLTPFVCTRFNPEQTYWSYEHMLTASMYGLLICLLFSSQIYYGAQQKMAALTRASEQCVRQLIEENADGIIVLDQQGCICFVNPATEALLGQPADKLTGTPFDYPIDLGQSSEIDLSRDGKDKVVAQLRAVELEWLGETAILISLRDISALKKAEESLRASEVKLISSNRNLKTLSKCNEALVRSTDETLLLEELCRIITEYGGYRMALVAFLDPDDRQSARLVAQAGYEGAFIETATIPLADPQAGPGPVWSAMQDREIVLFRKVDSDQYPVTWRAEALKQGYDSAIGLPLQAGDDLLGALAIYGTDPSDFAKQEVDILHNLADNMTYGIIALRNRKARGEAELALQQHSANLEREVKVRTKELEEKIIDAEKANRAKSDFLANMSHELRTPLNAIIGFSDVLSSGISGPLSGKQNEYLNDISESGHHLLSLINDILDLAKVETGKQTLEISTFLLSDVLNNGLTMLKEKTLRHGINLSLEIEPGADVILETDELKMKQIMLNLLSNAVKFTPDGGDIRVVARLATDIEQKEECVEISVIDTGIGIRPQDISRLFKPFSQLESVYTKSYQGTGLGLALTRQLVELHKGKIWVESEFGKGSTFTFVLPLRQANHE